MPSRAGNGTRTRDPNLGKVVLYQLSYSRVGAQHIAAARTGQQFPTFSAPGLSRLTTLVSRLASGGEGDRTPDLVNAIHALSQLSYAPDTSPFAVVEKNSRWEPKILRRGRWQVKQKTLAKRRNFRILYSSCGQT